MSDIVKKPEKLASAVYFVSGFFNDQEPIKWKLRSLASDFISATILQKDNYFTERDVKVMEMNRVVAEIISLFNVAEGAGMISSANANLIRNEFGKYVDAVGLPQAIEKGIGNSILSSEFFLDKPQVEKGGIKENVEVPAEEIKDKKIISAPVEEKEVSEELVVASLDVHKEEEKRHLNGINERIIAHMGQVQRQYEKRVEPQTLKEFGVVSVKKSGRRSVIIGLLKRKKEIMIKDVSPLISGCSEKTIQRELLAMVDDGILQKVGEKRWSRYSLVQKA